MSLILEDINKGLLFVKMKNMPRLRHILSYQYNVEEKELNKMKQHEFDSLIKENGCIKQHQPYSNNTKYQTTNTKHQTINNKQQTTNNIQIQQRQRQQ